MANHRKSSAEIEREIEGRRARIEQQVDQITSKVSPGQLLDEALRYMRKGPVADYTRNLGHSVVENPMPLALMGASLAWLAVQSNLPRGETSNDGDEAPGYSRYVADDDDHYPVATIQGRALKRLGIVEGEEGRHSEFADDAGRKFKALTDEAGQRAGHFIDDSGRMFGGFIDETGDRVTDFRDEAGNRLHRAAGWASHSWHKAGEDVSAFGDRVRREAGRMGEQAQRASDTLQRQGGRVARMADDFVHDQPLVSGLIAFAIGALFGGALPSTREEDKAFGEAADKVKDGVLEEASHLYNHGREEAAHIHDGVRAAVEEAHESARH